MDQLTNAYLLSTAFAALLHSLGLDAFTWFWGCVGAAGVLGLSAAKSPPEGRLQAIGKAALSSLIGALLGQLVAFVLLHYLNWLQPLNRALVAVLCVLFGMLGWVFVAGLANAMLRGLPAALLAVLAALPALFARWAGAPAPAAPPPAEKEQP